MHRWPKEKIKQGRSTVEATTEMNPNDHRSVAEALIMQPAEAPLDETSEAPVEQDVSDDQIDQPDEIIEDEDGDGTEPEVFAEPVEERMYTVKIDGNTQQVNEQELTRGYSGQQKIQQGMRELAEARKLVEAQSQKAHELQQQHAESLAQLNSRLQNNDLTPPDKDLRETDPIGYLVQIEEYRDAMSERQSLQAEQYQMAQQQQAQQTAQRNQYVQEQAQSLMEQIPILKDPVEGPKVITGMMTEGVKYGFSEAEMQNEIDTRFVKALHRLHYLETRGNIDSAPEIKRGAIKPGAKRSNVSNQQKAALSASNQMKRTGRTEDVAQWIMSGK
jgi:hypothetical protein